MSGVGPSAARSRRRRRRLGVAACLLVLAAGSSAPGPSCGPLAVEVLGPPLSHDWAIALTHEAEPRGIALAPMDGDGPGAPFLRPVSVTQPSAGRVSVSDALVRFHTGAALLRPTSFAVRLPATPSDLAPEMVLTVREAAPKPPPVGGTLDGDT